jgi:NAD(P)-dependent dehydrogenase (short-subunit alcohol dehydrogenase family)
MASDPSLRQPQRTLPDLVWYQNRNDLKSFDIAMAATNRAALEPLDRPAARIWIVSTSLTRFGRWPMGWAIAMANTSSCDEQFASGTHWFSNVPPIRAISSARQTDMGAGGTQPWLVTLVRWTTLLAMDPFRLDRRVALITGGGSGLGLAIAEAMVQAGAQVILVGRDRARLQAAASKLGGAAMCVTHDISADVTPADLAQAVRAMHEHVDILVNCAGVHLKRPALETDPEDFRRVLEVHVLGAHRLVQAFAPAMVARHRGAILFIVSMTSLFGIPQVIAYSAAKSAQLGLMRTLATELSASGVRVNAIAPGWIDTDMSRTALEGDPERLRRILQRTPMNRLGVPEDVGHAAVFLCSDAARFVTGAVLPVDGGFSVGF